MNADGSVQVGRDRRYAVSMGTLASLLAGRTTYRSLLLVSTVLLLVVWGEQRYAAFAAAMGALSWLQVLVLTGPEKTMLKLRPRAPRVGAALNDALLAVVWWSPLPLAAAFVAALWWQGPNHAAPMYLGVAAMQFSIGCTILLVGLHRAAGRPRADSAAFLLMSAAQAGLLAAAVAGLGPIGYVGAIVVLQLVVNLVLTARLGRPSLRIRHRPRLLRRLGVTALLLSGSDLYVYLSTAVLFMILSFSAHAAQVARLYPVVLVWSGIVALLIYLLRVYTPGTSLRLVGPAGRAGRFRAARLARWLAVAYLGWLVAAVVVLAGTDLTTVDTSAGRVLVWTVLLASRAPLFAALLWLTFQVENTDATAPRAVASAAVAGLVAAGVAGLVLVPALGGVGQIVAGGVGELGYSALLAVRAAGRSGVPASPAIHTGASEPVARA